MTCKWISVCPLRELEKKKEINSRWKKNYCESDGNWKSCERFKLEEKGIYHENILPDGSKIGRNKNG